MIVNGGIDVELFDSALNKILDERVSSKFPSLFVLNLAETRRWLTWFRILATAPEIVVGSSASIAHLNMCALASSKVFSLDQFLFCFCRLIRSVDCLDCSNLRLVGVPDVSRQFSKRPHCEGKRSSVGLW